MTPPCPSQNFPLFFFVGGPRAIILFFQRDRFALTSSVFNVILPRGYALLASPGYLATTPKTVSSPRRRR